MWTQQGILLKFWVCHCRGRNSFMFSTFFSEEGLSTKFDDSSLFACWKKDSQKCFSRLSCRNAFFVKNSAILSRIFQLHYWKESKYNFFFRLFFDISSQHDEQKPKWKKINIPFLSFSSELSISFLITYVVLSKIIPKVILIP